MNESKWNPWHGCHKISPGCLHCYVYRADQRHGQDGKTVRKTASFDMPLRRDKKGDYKIPPVQRCSPALLPIFLWRRRMLGVQRPGG